VVSKAATKANADLYLVPTGLGSSSIGGSGLLLAP
jgi:hypothetical protein